MRDGWEIKKLGEVCESDLGKTLNQSTDTGELQPYLCAINVLWDKIELSTVKQTRFEKSEMQRYSVRKGDLLICEGGDIGRAAIWDKEEPMLYQNALHRVRFDGSVLPRFCLLYLRSLKDAGILDSRYGKGVTIKHLVKSSLLSIPIPVPPLSEQEHIVEELDLLSGIIEKQKQQLKEYDTLAQSIFYDMFGDPVTNEKGWEVKKLEDIAESRIGLTYKPENVSETGTIVLRSGNIQNSALSFDDIVRVQCNIKESLFVQENDILMCSRNGSANLVGKVALIKDIKEPMSYGAFMTIIRSKYQNYLFAFFKSPAFRQQLTSAKTATINQITVKMLNDIEIPVPPLTLQQEFVSKIEAIEKQKAILKQSIEEAETLFNSRMDYYFN